VRAHGCASSTARLAAGDGGAETVHCGNGVQMTTGVRMPDTDVALERWGLDDLPLLERANSEEMTRFLGGPETAEQLAARHERYLSMWESGDARMFRIVTGGEAVGGIGYWRIDRAGEPAYETGWNVDAAHQGRGIAGAALTLCIDHARRCGDARRAHLYAFPIPANAASNRLCERAGFTLVGREEAEYPPGNRIVVNVWRLALRENSR